MDKESAAVQVPCPVCGASAAKRIFQRPDLTFLLSDHAFSVVRCLVCGMGYVRDRPSPERLASFYSPLFYQQNHEHSGQERFLARKLHMVEKAYGKAARGENKPRLLDVGCAGGEFVTFAGRHGWDAFGYEWSDTASLPSGAAIVHAPHMGDAFNDASFDAITAWAVLEHAVDLRELTGEISRKLKPGGIFIALVTNFNSIPALYMRQDDVPRHLNLFTKKSLTRLLRDHGLVPRSWSYDNAIFSGSHRGLLVFLLKRLAGESMESIVEQHRAPGRRAEFCGMLRSRPSRAVELLCRFDRSVFAPALDTVASLLGYGFTMTVTAIKE